MDENDESLVFLSFWDCRTHVPMTSSIERTDLVFKISVALLLTNLDQILCVVSLGLGKGCIRFWGRLDQNSGFHGNRKPPSTYNGKNDLHLFSFAFDPLLFILAGNEDMHKISDKFEFWPDRTTD